APRARPGRKPPRAPAEVLPSVSTRVLFVTQYSPPRLVKSIQILKAAQLPQAELVVCETRRGALREEVQKTLAEHLPGIRLTATQRWDERRAAQAEDAGQPLRIERLVETLRL